MKRPIWVRLYEHEQCKLCHALGVELETHAGELNIRLERVDIRRRREWWEAYALKVPVVEIEGLLSLEAPVTLEDVRQAVSRVRKGYYRGYEVYRRIAGRLGRWELRHNQRGRMKIWRETFVQRIMATHDAQSSLNVLELAAGPGLNRKWMPRHWNYVQTDWIGQKPQERGSPECSGTLQITCDAHLLPFAKESFDVVVSTFSLCAFFNTPRVIHEVHRVLRQGGHWWSLDHVLGKPPISWLQHTLAPLWSRLLGCSPNRKVMDVLEATPGFTWEFDFLWDHLILLSHGIRNRTMKHLADEDTNMKNRKKFV